MPHLQALVERHEDEPFALIGINAYDDPKTYQRGLETYNVTWLSAYQGETTPISDPYDVARFPTYILIDATGKIRARGSDGKAMDEPIAKLHAELKESTK